mgnify:CR=1 FL=1
MAAHTFIVFTNFYIISEAKLFTLYSVQRCTTNFWQNDPYTYDMHDTGDSINSVSLSPFF